MLTGLWSVPLVAVVITHVAVIATSISRRRGLAHRALVVHPVAPLINGLGHWHGAQNFENTAYHCTLLAWVAGGESLHNNHHAQPRAPKFSVRWWEFDPSWVVLRALAAMGLVAVKSSVRLR